MPHMKGRFKMKNLYVIYNEATDIDDLVTEDLKDALIRADELIESGNDTGMLVLEYEGLSKEEYPEHYSNYNREYDLQSFCRKKKIFDDPIENAKRSINDLKKNVNPVIPVKNPEAYHRMSEQEKIEVLHFVSDEMLLDELHRRFAEYRKGYDKIVESMDQMKIYV